MKLKNSGISVNNDEWSELTIRERKIIVRFEKAEYKKMAMNTNNYKKGEIK